MNQETMQSIKLWNKHRDINEPGVYVGNPARKIK